LKITSIILVILMFLFPVDAVEDSSIDLPNAGTTPNNLFYFIDIAMEKMSLAFTNNEQERIQKQLEYAEERLAEARVMALKGNVKGLQKAEERHNQLMLQIKEKINQTEDSELRLKVQEHTRNSEMVQQEVQAQVVSAGVYSSEDQGKINGLMEQFRSKSGEVEVQMIQEREQERVGNTGDCARLNEADCIANEDCEAFYAGNNCSNNTAATCNTTKTYVSCKYVEITNSGNQQDNSNGSNSNGNENSNRNSDDEYDYPEGSDH